MRKLLTLLMFVSVAVSAMAVNSIKPGTARLTVTLECPDTAALANSFMAVGTMPMFNDRYVNELYQMQRKGTVYSLDVPLELEEEIVGVMFESGESGFGFPLEIRQSRPTDITVVVNDRMEYAGFKSTNYEGLHPEKLAELGNYLINFPVGYYAVPDSLYTSWQQVRDYEANKLFPLLITETFGSQDIPDWVPRWFVNNLKCDFASMQQIPYVPVAEDHNVKDVTPPPMEAYAFLDNIDYSPEFLKRLPYTSLKPFLYTLLRFPDGGFAPIGESDVDTWQEMVREKLRPAIQEPAPLLLDLLAAMSYVAQIDVDKSPLTPVQIDNINRGFHDGLKDILLDKNGRLLKSRAGEPELKDLTGVSFDLMTYINDMYPGKPVIVDTWNTWCIPCLDSMAAIDMFRKQLDTSDIVFVCISSESSPLEKWKSVAPGLYGQQIRISETDFSRIGEQYGLTVLPSYLVFDRAHNLKEASGGAPAFPDFERWVALAR